MQIPLTPQEQRVCDMVMGETPVLCSGCKRKLYSGDYREYRHGKPVCHRCLFPLFKGNRNGKAK